MFQIRECSDKYKGILIRLQYKRYDAHFLKKRSVELPFSSFGDHLINILRKVNQLIYA
jgi:hypothetical protein